MEQLWHSKEKKREIYRLLSRCYYVPGAHTFTLVAALYEALLDECPEIAHLLNEIEAEQNLDVLAIDFSRLFVGPFKLLAPPYGSVYLDSGARVMGESTAGARNRYRQAGLDFSDKIKEAPDHIALELEFMYFLIFQETEALAREDAEAARASMHGQLSFLTYHLGAWVDEFTVRAEVHATTQFYRCIARVTREFVQQHKQELAAKVIAARMETEPA